MSSIFLDSWRMEHSGPPHYSSLGNKLLHLFFCISYAKRHRLSIGIPQTNNLDKIFNISSLIRESPNKINIFQETTAHGTTHLETISRDSKNQFMEELFFLESELETDRDIYVKGHFYHYELMPTLDSVRDYMEYNDKNYADAKDIIETCSAGNRTCVFVHYRGTDFAKHENKMGDCRVPLSYYEKSFELCQEKFSNPLFICFSDETDFYSQIDSTRHDIQVIKNEYAVDWMILHLSDKMISSNSSFCWTASLHNKEFLIQPRNGLNSQQNNFMPVPYGFQIPGAILV